MVFGLHCEFEKENGRGFFGKNDNFGFFVRFFGIGKIIGLM